MNFEQQKIEQTPPPKPEEKPETAQERLEKFQAEAKAKGKEMQERRAQREGEAAAKERFALGSRVPERIKEIEREMAEERKTKETKPEEINLKEAPAKPVLTEAETKTPAEADEESKRAQWKAAAAEQSRITGEKMRNLFYQHGETPEKEAETHGQDRDREATREEIARHLVERPGEALDIFKKGVGLKLEKAAVEFTTFWKRAGVEVLKGLSLPVEKTAGSYLGGVSEAAFIVGEFFERYPGVKRLQKVLEMHAQLERLKKEAATPEQVAQLEKLLQSHKYAAMDEWEEVKDFNKWHEEKSRTLDAFRTFGRAREKLSRWSRKEGDRAMAKKESAAQRRAGEVKGKL